MANKKNNTMKRIHLLLFSLLVSVIAIAQVTINEEEGRYGIFNTQKKRWVVDPAYLKIRQIGIYDGYLYFALCSEKDHKWGIMRSDNYKKMLIPNIFDDVECYPNSDLFSTIPILCIREKSGWGIIELGSGEFWYIRESKYKSIRPEATERKIYCQYWDASQPDDVLSDNDLKKSYEYVLKEVRKNQETIAGKPNSPSETQSRRGADSGVRPTCKILSPADGSTYSSNTIRLRYTTNLRPNNYTITFKVDGGIVEPISIGTEKGAKVEQGIEVELPMPQVVGKDVNIELELVDKNDFYATPSRIVVKYTGEKQKPALRIFAVGISDYPAADLPNLNYAAKDAQDFEKAVSESDLQMYSSFHSKVILNHDATASNIRKELVEFCRSVNQDDVVMLFFSGHGISEDEDSYFLTYDASAENFYDGVEFAFIRRRMSDLVNKHSHVIIFMDACQSGAMAGTKGAEAKGIAYAIPGVIGYYSSTSTEKSAELEDLENGVFTHALLDALNGKAANEKGEITAYKLEDYLQDNVRTQTRGKQTPIIENNLGEFVLLHTSKKK